MSLAEIQDEALELSREDRARLTALLIDSFPEPEIADGEPDSVAEAHNRGGELDSGEVQPLSQEQFDAGMKAYRRK